jgi:hypothetical protein
MLEIKQGKKSRKHFYVEKCRDFIDIKQINL